jgi:hypothetical protein
MWKMFGIVNSRNNILIVKKKKKLIKQQIFKFQMPFHHLCKRSSKCHIKVTKVKNCTFFFSFVGQYICVKLSINSKA